MGVMKRIYTALSEGDAVSDAFLKRVCTTGYKGFVPGNKEEKAGLPEKEEVDLHQFDLDI